MKTLGLVSSPRALLCKGRASFNACPLTTDRPGHLYAGSIPGASEISDKRSAPGGVRPGKPALCVGKGGLFFLSPRRRKGAKNRNGCITMDSMKGLEIFEDHESLVRAAAERIAATLAATLKEKGSATFVLTGGNTPKPIYERLAQPPYSERIPWDRVDFFWGDERCVPLDHPDSNFGMAWKAFLSRLTVTENSVHRLRGALEDHVRAAVVYEK